MHYCSDGFRLYCMNHWQPSPASFFLEAGKLISYETRTYVCVHMLCRVTAAAICTCASLAKNIRKQKKSKPSNKKNPNKPTKQWVKKKKTTSVLYSFIKIRIQRHMGSTCVCSCDPTPRPRNVQLSLLAVGRGQ